MRALVLVLALASPLAAQAPPQWTEVVVDPAVLAAAETVYRTATREVVFCIDGEHQPEAARYVVHRLVLAPQNHNSATRAEFDCTGYQGWVHNHRDRGGRYCRVSETDRAVLRDEPDMVLAIGWCRDGHWFHAFAPG